MSSRTPTSASPARPDAERTPLNCCVWRYHPLRHEFETFANGTSNPWGVDFDDHGQAFITACVIPHMFHMIQGGRYHRQGGQHFNPYTYDDIKTIADHRTTPATFATTPGGAATNQPPTTTPTPAAACMHCGAMIYLGDNWPTEYRNTIFMANIHGNRVNNDKLKREGSGFIATHGHDFLFANDRWFRGINLRYGPDGSVYLIDWYDPNACHRNQPEIWDRSNGRIYRISYGDRKPVKVDLSKAGAAQLIDYQWHKNDWYVRTARRLLQEGAEANRHAQPDAGISLFEHDLNENAHRLAELANSEVDVARRLRGMWALHVIRPAPTPVIGETLTRLSAQGPLAEYVRAWGIQLALESRPTDLAPELLEKLTSLAARDPSPLCVSTSPRDCSVSRSNSVGTSPGICCSMPTMFTTITCRSCTGTRSSRWCQPIPSGRSSSRPSRRSHS
ncbi:MAG: hypothetical protein R3B90_21635 [Planctomycetaceae bacterium]